MLKTANNKGALTTTFYGIRWGHYVNGFETPTDHPFVALAFEGAVRLCSKKPKTPKDPLTPEILKELITQFNSDSLTDLRFLIICSLGFFGFLRIEELLQVQLKDIKLTTTHLEIFLKKSKNDQHRDGKTVYISRNESEFCPVKLTEKFFTTASITLSTHENVYLVPRLVKIKKGHKIHPTSGISYTRTREIFNEYIKINETEGNYGLHSLRSGGASAAAENMVDERLISKHGRWSSDRARNMYIKDSLKNRLSVTRNLGI